MASANMPTATTITSRWNECGTIWRGDEMGEAAASRDPTKIDVSSIVVCQRERSIVRARTWRRSWRPVLRARTWREPRGAGRTAGLGIGQHRRRVGDVVELQEHDHDASTA